MCIIFLIIYTQAILKEELYEYQVGLILTHQQEDFILLKPNPNNINFQNEGFQIHDEKVVLISEINHKMDRIIDMKQNEYSKEDYVWILYERDDKSILQKQSISDFQYKEFYYLQLNFECYTFYFISNSQIAIDCQDSISNIIVLFDIKNKVQQSFYYSYYKKVRLRKLMITQSSNMLVLIQQDQILLICLNQNKYQICDSITFENNAHQALIYDNQITLISDYLIDVFQLFIVNEHKIVYVDRKNFSNIQLEPNYPLLYYFHNPFNKQQYFIYDYSFVTCIESCFKHELDGKPLQIKVIQNYIIIQTNYSIQIIYLTNGLYFKIQHVYNNDFIVMNKILHEVLLLNTDQLKFYGLTQKPYNRIKNKRQLLLIDLNNYYYKNQIDDIGQDSIYFDERFKFKVYFNFSANQNAFVAIGGALNVTFQIEDSFKDHIKMEQRYFLETKHQDVKYYFFSLDERQKQILITINGELEIFHHNISNIKKQTQNLIRNKITTNLTEYIQVLSFDDAYYLTNQSNGQNFVMRQQMDHIELIQFQCLQDYSLIWCISILCICQGRNQIYFKLLDRDHEMYIEKLVEEEILYLDYAFDVSIAFLKNSTHLIIKHYNYTSFIFLIIHTQTIKLCNNFINLVSFQFKLILVCSQEIILYNKLSNFRFVISGNVELYDEQFKQSSQVIQSKNFLYYIIDNQILYVFDSFLSLKQQYITKIQIGNFSDVKVHDKHICFQYDYNLKCYYYQINIKFNYETDKVEYHQVFKVNVCAENIYDKKCQQYISRLDQQNRRISIYKNIYQLVIQENTQKINLNYKFYTGSVDKIYVNHPQLKPKIQLQAYIKILSDKAHKSYYNGFENQIFILNNVTLTIYDVVTRKMKSIQTRKRMFFILKHKFNLILLGPSLISVINCEFTCKEIQYFEEKIPLQGFLQIINNTLYSTNLGLLTTYNLDDLSLNKSVSQIDEQSGFYQIDIQQDKTGQICMIYLSYDGTLVFKYLENKKQYHILELLKQIGFHLEWSNPDAVYSAKILDDCRLVLLSTVAGYYFLELSDDLILRAQIAVQDLKPYKMGQLLIGYQYHFYIQVLLDSVAIYKFTYAEIYDNKFIDFCKKLDRPHIYYNQNEDFFYTYNDELYQVQQRFKEYVINKIDLDNDIQLDNQIGSKKKFLIELSNPEEAKSFIIELLVEVKDYNLIYSIIAGFLIAASILLISQKRSVRAQQIL